MTELRIYGCTNKSAVKLVEFFVGVSEGEDLSWADESEVKRVEEEANPSSLELVKLEGLEILLLVGYSFEVRSWLSNDGSWVDIGLVNPFESAGDTKLSAWTGLLVVMFVIVFHC